MLVLERSHPYPINSPTMPKNTTAAPTHSSERATSQTRLTRPARTYQNTLTETACTGATLADPFEVKRRLAAIFAADVEGYSRLMGADEVAILDALTARRTKAEFAHASGFMGTRP